MNVILLHGFGENANIWDTFIPLLPSEFKYHTLDYSRITFCDSIEQYADWVHSEVEQLGITRFALIGHSMGGYITLAYAHKYKEYLCGLGLFHSTSYADNEAKKKARDKTAAFIEKQGSKVFIEGFLPNMYHEDFRRRNAVYIKQQLEDNVKLPEKALIKATQAMRDRDDHRAMLARIDMPVLMIVGKQDPFVGYEDSLTQIGTLQNPYVLIEEHVAHAGMKESPEASAALTSRFLRASFA